MLQTEKYVKKRSVIRQQYGMMLYMLAIYVPLIIRITTSPYDITRTSLSSIAWNYHDFPLLILYGILTLPFLLYEICFYMKYNKKKDWLLIPLLVGWILLCLGIIFPYNGELFIALHCDFSQVGSIILILAISVTVWRYCQKLRKCHKGRSTIITVFYGILLAATAALFILTGTSALLEVSSTFIYMVIFLLVNKSLP